MCPQSKVKDTKYNRVATCNYNTRDDIVYCDNLRDYNKLIKQNPLLTEIIGGSDNIKPVFDIDAYETDINIDEVKSTINTIFPDKDIYFAKREPRIESHNNKDVMKYSYRAYVQQVQISFSNMKYLFQHHKLTDDIRYDISIYKTNAILLLPHTTQKMPDSKTGIVKNVPELLPFDEADIFQCSASYIEADFEDWNVKVEAMENKHKKIIKNNDKILDILKYSDIETCNIAKELVLKCLSLDRCNIYTDWLNLGFCLYNIDDSLFDVWDEYSKKGDTYKAGECEKLWSNMKKSSIGIGSLKYWAKKDNDIAYYEIVFNSNHKYVMDAVGTDGSHYDVAKVCYNYFKGKLYYDTTSKCYYSVNDNTNIWKKDGEGLVVSHYLSTTICELFMKTGAKIMNDNIDVCVEVEQRKINDEKIKKCIKIATKLKDENYTNSIKKSLKSLCAIENFNCNVLDVDINTFAFNNCLFDLEHKVIRNIEPADHISTTTGYAFDINVSKDKRKEIKHLIRSMFKTDEMYDYLIDVLSMSMFGKNLHQEFYIFNGLGSNGKSVLMNLLLLSFGDYCGKVNSSTFTKESRGANETSELHACKASRLVCVEEPNEKEKLISSRLKEYSGDTIIKTRGLHENAFSFNVMFCMIFYCNQLCELSKIDNAVGRRLRLLNFPFKFCDEPNPKIDTEKLADMSWGTKLNNKKEDCIYYKQAFMLLLWENWCKRDFVNKKIDTPKEVMDITKQYMNDCNKVKLYIDDFCDIVDEEKERIPARELFTNFKSKYPDMDERSFAYNMMELGIEKKRFSNCFKYINIKYKEINEDD